MQWLEAALAFALVMLVFATMVSTITEMILRALNSREAHFKIMVEEIYRKVLLPQVQRRLANINVDSFLTDMTENPVDRPVSNTTLDWWRGRFLPRSATQMTVMEFMERLGSTDIGRAIHAEGQARVNDVINDLAQKYERFCAGTRARFAAKAQLWGVPIAIILAFGLNVDAVRVFNTFLSDSKVRAAVIAQQEVIEANAVLAQDKLQKTLEEIVKKQDAVAANPGNEQARKDMQQLADDAKGIVKAVGNEVDTLWGLGVPVGHTLFPYCQAPAGLQKAPCGTATAGDWLGWAFSTLLAGLLIGLGAPFWFDLAQGLTKSLQLLRALKPSSKDEEQKPEQPQQAVSGADPPPRNVVEAFTRAASAGIIEPPLRIRHELAADGHVIREE